MSVLRPILADQLSFDLPSLASVNPKTDVLVFCEVHSETDYVPHHPQKIIFLFSAMRHFSQTCREMGFKVHYVQLDDPGNTQNLTQEWERIAQLHHCSSVSLTMAGEWRLSEIFKNWQAQSALSIELLEDSRFLCTHQEFADWAKDRKQLRMEYFYQMMRKKYQILLTASGTPEGGRWNFDIENRDPLKDKPLIKPRLQFSPDDITLSVMDLVKKEFSHHFGDIEPFYYACTAHEAHLALEDFLEHHLPSFGQYQDVMMNDEPFLHHAILSMYINVGFIEPQALCRRVETLYQQGKVPIAAAEGFIRQVLGWREFIRGIYWYHMPTYAEGNQLNGTRALPALYWGQDTKMNCLKQVVSMTKKYAYSHHIQRLMVTGNFALLAELRPVEVCAWYLAVYIDAYEWVELPNTLGMALFADGGVLASKPYAASARYIDKMSNFCKGCHYQAKKMTGDKACPFNSLYWNFIARNQDSLKSNPRMAYMYATWGRFSEEKRQEILAQAQTYLERLEENSL